MKRFLITALLVLFATAAYAEVKFELTGDFHARGTFARHQFAAGSDTDFAPGPFIDSVGANPAATPDKVSFTYYDGDINLYPKVVYDNTSLTFKLAIRDETWRDPEGNRPTNDDNIAIERAFLTHKFDNGFILDAGLMDGQTWGTAFGDYLQPRYRVKVTKKTSIGVFGALVEKMSEFGEANPTTVNAEKDDWDDFAVFMVTKVGDIWIKPLIFYVHKSDELTYTDLGAADNTALRGYDKPFLSATHGGVNQIYYSLELSGKLGDDGLAFESELNYKPIEYTDMRQVGLLSALGGVYAPYSAYYNANNAVVYGAYVNVWKTLDAGKFGLLATYGNWDSKGGATGQGVGLDTRDDFCANLILGDWYAFGGSTAEDLLGMTFFKLYAEGVSTGVDKLTVGGSFGYIFSNQRNSDYNTYNAFGVPTGTATYENPYRGATAMEVDLNVTYAITDNLAYSIDAGYAKINYDYNGGSANKLQTDPTLVESWDDPDPLVMVQHKIKFTF